LDAAAVNLSKRFKIADRGFLLFSVPLLFVLVFFWELVEIQRLNEDAQVWSLHSHDVTSQTEAILRGLSDAEAAVNGYLLTGNPDNINSFSRVSSGMHDSVRQLQTLVSGSQTQELMATQILSNAE